MKTKLITNQIYSLIEAGKIEELKLLKSIFAELEVANIGYAYIKGIHYVTEKISDREEEEASTEHIKLYYEL